MGGSFNPPTIAHLKLMRAAIEQLSAGAHIESVRGVFVPSSYAYVRRKMSKLPDSADHTVLPEKLRYDMLNTFNEIIGGLCVDGRELGTSNEKGHTIDTLSAIQKENPNAQVYFIFGGDKLEGLTRWGSYEPMVKHFKIIIFERNGVSPKQIIQSNEELSKYADSFVILQTPKGINSISSTAVRERVSRNERADDMLTHEVYTMLLADKKKKDNTILCFQGDYHFLSNFERAQFSWDYWPYWDSAEAAFQSAKCVNEKERRQFTKSSITPSEAKRMGRRVRLRPDWEQIKDGIMEEIVRAKFFQIEPFARKLMDTGNAELMEGNTWGDTYWGVDLFTMQGQNKLGKILMKIRAELNSISPEDFIFKVKTPYVDA